MSNFVYAKVGKDPSLVTILFICSAVITTFGTFIFGTWADRTGNRRRLISTGYIFWGFFTIVFSLTQFISQDMYILLAAAVILVNAIMCLFCAMANEAGYNIWINDIMTDKNRGGIGAALALQPSIGTLLGTVFGGFLIGEDDNYMRLFVVMGAFVAAFGVISLLKQNKNDDVIPVKKGSFVTQFFSVFNFKEFFKLKELVILHVGIAIFFVGYNVYFVYLGNYLIHYLGYTADMMGIIQAGPMILAMFTAIPISILINKNKHAFIAIGAVVINIIGLIMASGIKPSDVDTTKIFDFYLWLCVFLVCVGCIAMIQTTKVWAKQLYPKDAKGQFEGIWTIFYLFIPKIFGSVISEAVVKTSGETFIDEVSGKMQYIPNGNIFIGGAVLLFISLIPFILTIRYYKKRITAEKAV
ncbi:MAG: MFS transporter [Clostridia bacterium]|nr:MFS transporter [Clostridia bacterium]